MIKNYKADLQIFRVFSRNELNRQLPGKSNIDDLIDRYFKDFFNYFEENPSPEIDNGRYISGLLCSFFRTYYITLEHIEYSELVEASVLLRKQIELLSRLYEITNEDRSVEKLLGKTPNIKTLFSSLKYHYDDYSKIAHSASPEPLVLLCIAQDNDKRFFKIYPEYQEDQKTAYQHLLMTFVEFFCWNLRFLKKNQITVPSCMQQRTFDLIIKFINEDLGEK
jgi:hypothetical protein